MKRLLSIIWLVLFVGSLCTAGPIVGRRIAAPTIVAASSSTYLFDQTGLTTPIAGWALFALDSSSVDLIRVRRSSDNAECDVEKDATGWVSLTSPINNLSAGSGATLTAWAGSDSCYITTLYDQGGSGLNAVQATAAAQPRIVNAGALDVDATNGKAHWVLDGGDILTASSVGIGSHTICTAVRSTVASKLFWEHGANSGSLNGCYLYNDTAANLNVYRGGIAQTTSRLSSSAGLNNGTMRMLTTSYDGTDTGNLLWINGAAQTLTITLPGDPGTSTATTTFNIGGRNGGSFQMTGSMQVIAIWALLSDTDRGTAETTLNTWLTLY